MTVTTEEMEALVLEHQGLIYWCLKPYKDFKSSRYDYEDLVQVAHASFVEAIKNFDESKSKITTFAPPHIQGRVSRFIKKNTSSFSVPSDYNHATTQLPTAVSLYAKLSDDVDVEDLVGEAEDSTGLISLLTTVEKLCHDSPFDGDELFTQWKMWRLWGYTQKEVANFYGLERATLAWRFKTIENKLKLMEES